MWFCHETRFISKNVTKREHSVQSFFGETMIKTSTDGAVDFNGLEWSILKQDANFLSRTVECIVPNDHIAVHFVNGMIVNTLPSGEYCFWNVFKKNTFEIIDISEPIMKEEYYRIVDHIPLKYYTRVEISAWEIGMLFIEGKFAMMLQPGSHYFWNRRKINCQVIDLRKQQFDVAGQEILTADKVALRVNFVCQYQITDPAKIITEIKDYQSQIYVLTQLTIRELVGQYKFDELLEQKDMIGNKIVERLREKQADYFIEFLDAGVKDIILRGEIRDIMNTVLLAEKRAQANVISRREEVASTRSLLNTAKLMDENKTLYKLKEIEALERICDKVGHISIHGGDHILNQLATMVSSSDKDIRNK